MERLCDFSVNVFHADALKALKGSGIPVRVKNTFNKYAAGTAITENAEESERSDEFFFASDKFGAIKNTLASKKEVGLYAEFLSQAENVADDEDEIFYFSDCDKSEELTEIMRIKLKCPVFKSEEGYITLVKNGEFLPEIKKIFYRFII